MADPAPDVSNSLVTEVAAVADEDPEDLPVLYEYVDPDALELFVEGTRNGAVSFEYAGYDVTVDSEGGVSVTGGPTVDVASGDVRNKVTD